MPSDPVTDSFIEEALSTRWSYVTLEMKEAFRAGFASGQKDMAARLAKELNAQYEAGYVHGREDGAKAALKDADPYLYEQALLAEKEDVK